MNEMMCFAEKNGIFFEWNEWIKVQQKKTFTFVEIISHEHQTYGHLWSILWFFFILKTAKLIIQTNKKSKSIWKKKSKMIHEKKNVFCLEKKKEITDTLPLEKYL